MRQDALDVEESAWQVVKALATEHAPERATDIVNKVAIVEN